MDHAHDIKKEVRRYMFVFAALMILTVVTVLISYLKVSVPVAITIALIVATIKGSLVACFFMHLISEKQFIYVLLTFTAIFFLSLGLIVFGHYNTPEGTDIWESDQRSALIHESSHGAGPEHSTGEHEKAAPEHTENSHH